MLKENGTPIEVNLELVRRNIAIACQNAKRNPASVILIAVTKNQHQAAIREAFALGITDFGESKVQEAERKIIVSNSLPPNYSVNWHFMGRLQTNKVKKAVELFEWIHSIDSLKLAEKINSEAGKQGKRQKALLQVNVSREGSKAGFHEADLLANFQTLLLLPHLQITGLMTIAPLSGDPERSRPIFQKLCLLQKHLQATFHHSLPELSMGMSQDYLVAIEEGATMVRIGAALFGKR
ncbi:MAG TPA: YggS family pyridoxal phosphate-dependent enzyme [Candidatus Norongarragalinales archaeon]|nr:YggS family pyridoxal phosphate-dependent enzyme [Candidatus Norongarragalinales archaeon]